MIFAISLFTIFANLLLGLLVYSSNKKSVTHILFLLFTFSVATWSLSNYFSLQADTPEGSLFLIRVALATTAVMFPLLYLFSINFPATSLRIGRLHLLFVLGYMGATTILSLTPFVFSGISIQGETITPIPGPGIFLFALNVLGFPIGAFIALLRRFQSASDFRKGQIRFLLYGITITFLLTTFTNFILVNIFKFTELVVLGPFFTLILVAFAFYAIIKHRLLNIRVLATELFTGLIIITTFVNVLFSKTNSEILIRGLLFVLVTIFGILLIRGALREIQALRELSEAKSEFISIASHQLRTPLSITKGYLSLLAEGSYGKLTSEQQNINNKLYSTNERMLALVNDFLNVSRAEEGKLHYTFQKTDIRDIINKEVNNLLPVVQEKGLTLTWQAPQEPYFINADIDKLRNVFMNLIDNSLKYTQKGGMTINISQKNSIGSSIRIYIKDTGIGLTKTELHDIFKRFERGKKSSLLNASGSGLGLYIAKKIIEDHGGKIWAESEGKNKGSTFIIELPLFLEQK